MLMGMVYFMMAVVSAADSCAGEEVCLLQLRGSPDASLVQRQTPWEATIGIDVESESDPVEIMTLKTAEAGCKGKIGKAGTSKPKQKGVWLIDKQATVESCQRACLEQADCNFALLKRRGKSKKWKCASFKKCKPKPSRDFMTFEKSEVSAEKAEEMGTIWKEGGSDADTTPATPSPTVPPTPSPTVPHAGLAPLPQASLPVEDLHTARAKNTRTDGRCTPYNGYKHTGQVPFLTTNNEPSVCEDTNRQCCQYTGNCLYRGPGAHYKCSNGDQYADAGVSVTKTRQMPGSLVESPSFAAVMQAGSEGLAWPEFTAHAVGLQYCEAKRTTSMSDEFWKWLEARPSLLLSLAATSYPVQGKTWSNFEHIWKKFQAEMEADEDLASNSIGFAFMNRKWEADKPIANLMHNAGQGGLAAGHSKGGYGLGKLPVQGSWCRGYEHNFPERDEMPTAIERIEFQIKHRMPGFPWPLVPHGYYPPNRECDWIRANPSAKCPYTMNLFKWMKDKTPPSSNPFCKRSDWHPSSLPRISQDGRVCGGCSYFNSCKESCLGKLSGNKPEPGHAADMIITASGKGKGRSYSMSSPWTVTAGYKLLSGSGVARAVPLIDDMRPVLSGVPPEKNSEWGFYQGYPDELGQRWPEMQQLLQAVSQDKLPKYDAARLAGMFVAHTQFMVAEDVKESLLLPLARRAAQLSPQDPELLRLLLKLNSKRVGQEGKSREADEAMAGVALKGGSYTSYHNSDPLPLALESQKCRSRKGGYPTGKYDCHTYGARWYYAGTSTAGRSGKGNDPFFTLGQVNASVERESSVGQLVSLAKATSLNIVTEEFEELWLAFEEELRGLKEKKRSELLKSLLSELPSAHVDLASTFRVSNDEPLIERCTFSLVAASVAQNFPEAVPLVEDARLALTDPLARSKLLAGKADNVDTLTQWIQQGKPAEGVVLPDSDVGPEKLTEWMKMMAGARGCTANGVQSEKPLEEDDDEDDEDANDEDLEVEIVVDDDFEELMVHNVDSTVESCYEQWTKSAAAAALREYLTTALR